MAILPFAAVFALVVAVEIQGQGSSPETVPYGNDDTAQKGEQGFPGKRGPSGEQGLQGPVGPKGDVGQCDPTCRTEYNELIERVQKLERIVSKTPAANCKEGLSWGRNISGIHSIVNPRNGQIMEVYCDQTTDNGGWLVFQRRTDGSENFYRTWAEYQEKFGNLSNEFWLGLENLHALTSSGSYELRVELEDCENDRRYAKYR
uniref:Fibrinogen C-terminal domain-containing protein n=1 Tax=Ciona intestinalis TaxID=7719 RepID=H2XK46_CIOIN